MRRSGIALLGIVLLFGSGLTGLGCAESPDSEPPGSITADVRGRVPSYVGGWIIEAQRAYENGRYRLALTYLDSVEAEIPRLADTYFLRGKIRSRLKQFTRADAAYEDVLMRDSLYPGVRLNRGINQVRTGNLNEALGWFRKEQSVEESSELYVEMGRTYQDLGKADSAEWAYRRAIDLDSSNATSHMWLGQLLEERGDVRRAVEHSRRALSLRPDDLDYQYVLGVQLLQLGRTEEALDLLEPAAKQMPWHHGAQYNMGRTLSRLDREKEAETYYARADSAQQMQHRIEKAGSRVNDEPQRPINWTNMGDELRKSGRLEDARNAYQVAAALAPRNLGIHINLANLYVATGDTAQGAARYRRILQIDSTLTDAWLNLGSLYAAMGREERARAALERALHNGGRERPRVRRYLRELRE